MMIHIAAFWLTATLASTHPLEDKIIYGQYIDICQAPFQVTLKMRKLVCGGSILTEKFVITAAHCTINTPASSIAVRAGSTFWDHGGQVVRAKQKFEHPKYYCPEVRYDVSILLVQPLTLGQKYNALPVILPYSGQTWPSFTEVTASGWGLTEFGEHSDYLKAVDMSLSSGSECKLFIQGEERICISNRIRRNSVDQGDSGGPLVLKNTHTLIGITSATFNEYMNIFANVSYPEIRQFIKEKTGL